MVHDADTGRRAVDGRFREWQSDGPEACVLVHVDVQPDEDFPRPRFERHHRLSDRYDRREASLAALAPERPGWRPESGRGADAGAPQGAGNAGRMMTCRNSASYCDMSSFARNLQEGNITTRTVGFGNLKNSTLQ